jgi:hypothetical protein
MKTVDDIEQATPRANSGGPSGAAGAGASGRPPADHHPGPLGRLWRRAWNGAVARSTAAIWMTMLIALPVVVAFLTVWGGPARPTHPDDLSVAALKLFSVWCLSFLPGWLYVRFLGQRAGALWNEYVVHLHRLGWDHPAYLPQPPANSEFYKEWRDAGGEPQDQECNLYREKFNAYYGRSVSQTGGTSRDFSVGTETMFPVFLATAVLAVCWVAVLWDTTSVTEAATFWDVLKFAFLGAYAFIVQSLIRRFFQSDLRPSAYAGSVLRIVVVLVTMVALYQLLRPLAPTTQAAVAFMVGFFPVIAFQALQRAAAATLRVFVPQLTPDYPLNQLDGLNVWYEARLVEEGIEDMQNLATANLVDVMLHTRVPVGRLVDWVDQAKLYLHLDRAERGYRERHLVRADPKPAVKDHRTGHYDPARPPSEPTPTPAANGNGGASGQEAPPAEGDDRVYVPLVHGSLSPHNRAGTKTRVALRQLGIRTATDLLKAFPPEEIDRRADANDGSHPGFRRLRPTGLDEDQIRTLVRVLDEDTALAPIWNYQIRGVQASRDCRRPRSERAGKGACADTTPTMSP